MVGIGLLVALLVFVSVLTYFCGDDQEKSEREMKDDYKGPAREQQEFEMYGFSDNPRFYPPPVEKMCEPDYSEVPEEDETCES